MAQRRMFSLKVVDTDAFCDMSASAQNLYFHIGMRADDEGFYAGVKGLMAKIHASEDDLRILIARAYILDRGDGVYVVKHWKMNNYLQNDRIKPTEYEEKKLGLYTKRDGSYTVHAEKSAIPVPSPNGEAPNCIQNVSIDKNSVVECSVEESSEEEGNLEENNSILGKEKINPVYTPDIVRRSKRAAEDCLRARDLKKAGTAIGPEWELTLRICADAIREYEDNKPF